MPDTLPQTLLLTAAPGTTHLDGPMTRRIAALLPPGVKATARWLAPGEAWEATFGADQDETLQEAVEVARAEVEGLPVDINVVPGGPEARRKKLLVADMESTIIEQEMLDELAEAAGLHSHISAITARAMRGEIAFEGALTERVRLLAGLDARVLEDVFARMTLMPGAATLIRTMNAHGATCALVSGGFTCFTARVAERLGFDSHFANTLEITGGKIAGTVATPILGAEAKLDTLRRLVSARGLDIADSIAVGDGANDMPMLAQAGLGVAFRAKPAVAAQAASLPNSAVITHGDLTALLYLQGYAKDDFIS